jgi:peptidoglycan hydrolase-like protein with peptidoglycan-binding domain
MAIRQGVAQPVRPRTAAPSPSQPGQPAAKTLWNEHAVNTVTEKGIQQAHVDQAQLNEAHRLSREVVKATGGEKLAIEDLAAIAQAYGVHLERHDASQLSAALNYINAAPTADQQQERLRKALINLQVLERGMPQIGRQETLNLMWGATRLPGHAVQNMSSGQLANTFQEVAGAIGQPGQHQLKVGKHNLKMNVSETNTVTSTSTKKPGLLSKIGSVLKKVGSIALAAASFIPGPIGIISRVAGAVIGAIKGIKERSILGTIAGIAGAVTAGASQIAGKVAQTVSKVANTVSRVVRGVKSGITAVKNGSVLGAIAGFGSAVAGGVQELTGKAAETVGRVANTVSRAARGVETAITAARTKNPSMLFGAIAGVAGSLAGATANATGRFASTMNQIATWARRGQSAIDTVEQAKSGDITGALASGLGLAAEIQGSNGSNGEDKGESVLDQVAQWANRADQAVGIVGAIREGDISQALWSGSALVAEMTKNGDVEDANQVIGRVRALEAAIRSDDPLAIREAFLGLTATVRQTVENVRERHFQPEIMVLPVRSFDASTLVPVVPEMQAPEPEIMELPVRPLDSSGLVPVVPGVNPNTAAESESGPLEYSQDVYIAQTLLNRLGEDLVPDGLLGPKTAAALVRFQSSRGLPATGQLDSETMDALVNMFAEIDSAPVEDGVFEELRRTQLLARLTITTVREQLDIESGNKGWDAAVIEHDVRQLINRLEQSLNDSQDASTYYEARDAESDLRSLMRAIEYKHQQYRSLVGREVGQREALAWALGGVETGADVVIDVAAPPWLKLGYNFVKTTGASAAEGNGLGWSLFRGLSAAGVRRFMNTKFLNPFLKSDSFKRELVESAVVEMGEAIPVVAQRLSQVWNTDNFQARAYQIIRAQAEASAEKLAVGLAAKMITNTSDINIGEINKRLQQSLGVDVTEMTSYEKQIALAGLLKASIFEGIKKYLEWGLSQLPS